MAKINNAVTNLIKELETRKSMLSSIEVKANLDTKSFDQITSIIKKHTTRPPQELIIDELVKFSISDVDMILHIMEVSPTEINSIIINFKRMILDYEELKTEESIAYLTKLKNKIVDYIASFLDIDQAQNDIQNSKVTEYQKYIDFLTSKTIDEPFSDIDSLVKMMTSLGMTYEDKWKVIAYIGELNLTIAPNVEEYNYASMIEELNKNYTESYPELVKDIKKYLESIEVDVELIPTIAENIAASSNTNKFLIKNIVISLLAESAYYGYQNNIANPEQSTTYLEILKNLLAKQVSKEEIIIENAKTVLSTNKMLYEHKDAEIEEYMDLLTSDLIAQGYKEEEAAEMRAIPILKSIAEILDKISSLEEIPEEDIKILEELTEKYQEIKPVEKGLTKK